MMVPIRPAFFLLALLFAASVQAEPPINYCHDPETNQTWDRLLNESPDDPAIRHLYKLRKNICRKIDGGEISVEQGTEIFEQQRREILDLLEGRPRGGGAVTG